MYQWQYVKNFLSSPSHTVCVVLSVPLLFFFFLGAGTPSHPDSVGCVTDVIGPQCGQTSISITDNRSADYLEGPTDDIQENMLAVPQYITSEFLEMYFTDRFLYLQTKTA